MATLISVQEKTGTFSPVSPEQYESILDALRKEKRVGHLLPNGNTGVAQLGGRVDVSWVYDGTANLNVTILRKHGLAALDPNQAVFDQLAAEFSSAAVDEIQKG